MHRLIVVLLLSLWSVVGVCASLEDLLGDYRNDPLFGKASSEHTVHIEILKGLLRPKEIDVRSDITVRFVVSNKTDEIHFLAFAEFPDTLIRDEVFKAHMDEAVWEASLPPIIDGEHTHAHIGLGEPRSLVKDIAEIPTVVVRPDEFKEVLIQFEPDTQLTIFSALPRHESERYKAVLKVK